MDMFDNYLNLNPDYIPDNEHKRIPCKCNTIVSGGTSTLVFELPVFYNENLLKIDIIFSQEARLLLTKLPTSVTTDEKHLYIKCILDSNDTKDFGRTNLNTCVQMKLGYVDKTLYTEITKIKVLDTLDNQAPVPPHPTPVPGTISGIGYSED